ncbi:MAG: AraC family transcriptional regulator ligand-binding domain-containing protein [Thermodesulfobacteriota bacterium]
MSPPARPTTRASWVAAIARALDHRGLDGRAIACRAGIPSGWLDDPARRIPVDGIGPLWRAAVRATGDDSFGLSVPPWLDTRAFGPFAEALLASETPYLALRRAARLASVLSDVVLVTVHDAGPTLRVSIDRASDARVEDEAIDAAVAALLGMVRLVAAPAALDPCAISLRRARPHAERRFARILRAPIAFGARRDVLEYSRHELRRPVPRADGARARRAERFASGEVVRCSSRVRDLVVDRLVDGPPSEREIARELGVSTRALQIRLAREGTTYRDVLETTREALARAHLGEGALPVKWIGSLLGFAHTSGFSRAFRQWTGMSPREFARRAAPHLGASRPSCANG